MHGKTFKEQNENRNTQRPNQQEEQYIKLGSFGLRSNKEDMSRATLIQNSSSYDVRVV